GDQPRLGQLSNPQVPPGAGDRHRSDRPADGETVGCRRTGCLGHSFGNLERGVRCNRRAAAIDSVYTGQGEIGDGGELMMIRMRNNAMTAVMVTTVMAATLALATTGAEAKERVKVGFIGPLTGGVSANGIGGRNSAD